VGPGRAESIRDDDGRRAVTAAGRYQRDLNPRMSIVVSGLYRNESVIEPRNGSGGLAFGFAPTPRVSLWTQADARFREGDGSTAYTLLNETGFEVYRGIWLTVSPQQRTDFGQSSGGVFRMALGANLLPRTHWNVVLKYYRDKNRDTDLVIKTFLAQLHLYFLWVLLFICYFTIHGLTPQASTICRIARSRRTADISRRYSRLERMSSMGRTSLRIASMARFRPS
jgi:hypothetical protein